MHIILIVILNYNSDDQGLGQSKNDEGIYISRGSGKKQPVYLKSEIQSNQSILHNISISGLNPISLGLRSSPQPRTEPSSALLDITKYKNIFPLFTFSVVGPGIEIPSEQHDIRLGLGNKLIHELFDLSHPVVAVVVAVTGVRIRSGVGDEDVHADVGKRGDADATDTLSRQPLAINGSLMDNRKKRISYRFITTQLSKNGHFLIC